MRVSGWLLKSAESRGSSFNLKTKIMRYREGRGAYGAKNRKMTKSRLKRKNGNERTSKVPLFVILHFRGSIKKIDSLTKRMIERQKDFVANRKRERLYS